MALEIANEIRRQLLHFGKIKVWSWGANSWSGGENFLTFKVQGHKFKGRVKITLIGNDLYDIEFIKGLKEPKVEKVYNDVFFDDMTDLIDEYVEKIPAYKH